MNKKNNNMCSFISKWKIQQYTSIRVKQGVITIQYTAFITKYFSSFIHQYLEKYQYIINYLIL